MNFRLVCTIFLVISACAFPLFFTIGVGLFSVIWFKNYYEIVPVAFLSDVLFGVPLERFYSFQYVMTLGSIVILSIAIVVRRQMFDNEALEGKLRFTRAK